MSAFEADERRFMQIFDPLMDGVFRSVRHAVHFLQPDVVPYQSSAALLNSNLSFADYLANSWSFEMPLLLLSSSIAAYSLIFLLVGCFYCCRCSANQRQPDQERNVLKRSQQLLIICAYLLLLLAILFGILLATLALVTLLQHFKRLPDNSNLLFSRLRSISVNLTNDDDLGNDFPHHRLTTTTVGDQNLIDRIADQLVHDFSERLTLETNLLPFLHNLSSLEHQMQTLSQMLADQNRSLAEIDNQSRTAVNNWSAIGVRLRHLIDECFLMTTNDDDCSSVDSLTRRWSTFDLLFSTTELDHFENLTAKLNETVLELPNLHNIELRLDSLLNIIPETQLHRVIQGQLQENITSSRQLSSISANSLDDQGELTKTAINQFVISWQDRAAVYAKQIRYWSLSLYQPISIVVIIVVTLIIFLLIGYLCCDCCCHRRTRSTKTGAKARCFALFLAFSCLFASLFLSISTALFFTSASLETQVCLPLFQDKNYNFLSYYQHYLRGAENEHSYVMTLKLMPQLLLFEEEPIGNSAGNTSLLEILVKCLKNRSFVDTGDDNLTYQSDKPQISGKKNFSPVWERKNWTIAVSLHHYQHNFPSINFSRTFLLNCLEIIESLSKLEDKWMTRTDGVSVPSNQSQLSLIQFPFHFLLDQLQKVSSKLLLHNDFSSQQLAENLNQSALEIDQFYYANIRPLRLIYNQSVSISNDIVWNLTAVQNQLMDLGSNVDEIILGYFNFTSTATFEFENISITTVPLASTPVKDGSFADYNRCRALRKLYFDAGKTVCDDLINQLNAFLLIVGLSLFLLLPALSLIWHHRRYRLNTDYVIHDNEQQLAFTDMSRRFYSADDTPIIASAFRRGRSNGMAIEGFINKAYETEDRHSERSNGGDYSNKSTLMFERSHC